MSVRIRSIADIEPAIRDQSRHFDYRALDCLPNAACLSSSQWKNNYAADFSKVEGVEERVVLIHEQGKWRLAGYWAGQEEHERQIAVSRICFWSASGRTADFPG
jgi:hypothetical protein